MAGNGINQRGLGAMDLAFMRYFLIFLICLLSVHSYGQGVAIRSLNGQATNLNVKGLSLTNITASRPAFLNANGTLTNATGTPDGTKFMRDDGVLSTALTYVTNANTLHVRKDGNDTSALRGRHDLPWANISNAVAAAQSGDTVAIWPGVYSEMGGSPINTGIWNSNTIGAVNLFNKSNISLVGIGRPELRWTNYGCGLNMSNAPGTLISGIIFRHKRFDTNGTLGQMAGITIQASSNVRVDNCDFLDMANFGIVNHDFIGSTNVSITGCYFYNCGFTNGATSLGGDGGGIVPGPYWSICNNTFDRFYRAVEPFPFSGGPVLKGLKINNNYFLRGWYQAIAIAPDAAERVTDLEICNNHFTFERAISMSGTLLPSFGIYVIQGGLKRFRFSGNQFYGTYSADIAEGGIWVESVTLGVSQGEISHNLFVSNGVARAITLYDSVAAGPTIDRVSVVDNTILGQYTGGIYLSGASNVISRNVISEVGSGDPTGNAINIANDGGVTRSNVITGNIITRPGNAGINFGSGASNNFAFNNTIIGALVQPITDAAPVGHNYINYNLNAVNLFSGTNENAVVFTRLGIGTNNPSAPLHVVQSLAAGQSLRLDDTNYTPRLQFGTYPTAPSFGTLWGGNVTPSGQNYAFTSDGTSATWINTSAGGLINFGFSHAAQWQIDATKLIPVGDNQEFLGDSTHRIARIDVGTAGITNAGVLKNDGAATFGSTVTVGAGTIQDFGAGQLGIGGNAYAASGSFQTVGAADGFSFGTALGTIDGALWRLGAAAFALGNGTSGNFAGTLSVSNINASGYVAATNSFKIGNAASPPTWTAGSGTPEGAVTAPVGSIYSRTDGGAATSFYVKESGTGNTGWVGK